MAGKHNYGYVRISSDPLGLEAGVKRQEQDERELAAHRGIELTEVIRDNDRSATNGGKRPGYVKLLAAIERGDVNTVICWHLSRLWRNRTERAQGIELCREHSVSVLCVKGPELDMSTAYGRGVAGLMGEFDTMEVEIKAERQKAANRQAVEQGKAPPSKRLFGYQPKRAGLVEDEAEAVHELFDRFTHGTNLSKLVRWLNEQGFRTPKGGKRGGKLWQPNTVRAMLRNPAYAGLRVYEGVEHKGKWRAIIHASIWRNAQRILNNPERFHTHKTTRRWLGTGLYRCSKCDDHPTMRANTKGRSGELVRVYRCPRSHHLAVAAEPIDEYVEEIILARLERPDARELFIEDAPDVQALYSQAENLRTRIDQLATERDDGLIDYAEYKDRRRRLNAKLTELEVQATEISRAPLLAKLVTAGDVRAEWHSWSTDDKREAIDALCVITIYSPGPGRKPFDGEKIVRIEPR